MTEEIEQKAAFDAAACELDAKYSMQELLKDPSVIYQKWHDAIYAPIPRDVSVREGEPVELRDLPKEPKPEVDPKFGDPYPRCVFPLLQSTNWSEHLRSFEKDGEEYVKDLWDQAQYLTRIEAHLLYSPKVDGVRPIYREHQPIPWTDRIAPQTKASEAAYEAMRFLPPVDAIHAALAASVLEELTYGKALGILMCYVGEIHLEPDEHGQYWLLVRDLVEIHNGIDAGWDYRQK